ncbi:MAG: DUF599 domain-containing protein [Gammaproteobacteria bacterium]|nr:DUF599 domain-containing protein [Gammaproteobacteria bacterium]
MSFDIPTSWHAFFDILTFVLCTVILAVYQLRLRRHIRNNPQATIQGMNAKARAAWIEHVMTTGRDVMAVQTFRNSTMAATLMASTAVLLIFGIFNILASADKISPAFHSINSWGSHDTGVRNFKLMLLMVDFFIAFFSFSLAVRGYHHAGYLVNVPLANSEQHGVTLKKVVKMLDRTSGYYSIGMRSYYFAVPVVMWLFGPVWMFVSTLVLLIILNHLDHLSD